MNFNFNNQRTKLHIAPPIMRHFSTFGLVSAKPEQNDYILKPDYIYNKNVHSNFFSTFQENVLPNKSFSNPNFVNKQNPNILSSVAGIFKLSKCHENLKSNYQTTRKHDNIIEKHFEEDPFVYQPLPEKFSSHNKLEMSAISTSNKPTTPSPKMSRKRRNRKKKQAKHQKQDTNQDQICNMTKKNKKVNCLAPSKFKRFKKPKKFEPWHKYDNEIMEYDESILLTPETPENEKSFDDSYCVENKTAPMQITPKCSGIFSETCTFAFSPCEIFKSLSSSSEVKSCSPSSPVINRLRQPSECDSEDSFIVFCDEPNECQGDETNGFLSDQSTEDETSDFEYYCDSESDYDIVDFKEKTDLNKCQPRKKVTFASEDCLCTIHPMIKWGFAYQSARRGPWEQLARDRARFEARINNVGNVLNKVLDLDHRTRIFHERFQDNVTSGEN